jgi:hypothetical protein
MGASFRAFPFPRRLRPRSVCHLMARAGSFCRRHGTGASAPRFNRAPLQWAPDCAHWLV